MDEGYIKFKCDWIEEENSFQINELIEFRNKLFLAGLIGSYDNGIGFGNISQRYEGGFIISGSATGSVKNANLSQFTFVDSYSIKENSVHCRGPVKASSESMSHAVLYEELKNVNCVIHIHNLDFWTKNLNKLPTVGVEKKYGTPEMAEAIRHLLINSDVINKRIFVTAGHEEGVFCFGKSVKEAFDLLMEYVEDGSK